MEPQPGGGSLTTESLSVVGRPIGHVSPRSTLRAFGRPRIAWSTAESTIVGGEAAVRLAADGPDRFDVIRKRAEQIFDSIIASPDLPDVARPRLLGGFAFHDVHEPDGGPPWSGFPSTLFILPAIQLTQTGEGTWLTAAAKGPEASVVAHNRLDSWMDRLDMMPEFEESTPPGIAARRPTPDRSEWRSQVRSALASIERGDLRKVVLAQSLEVDLGQKPTLPDVLARLGDTYPGCVRFLFEPADSGTFFGATPEELVSVTDRSVRTSVLAGSAGRGDTPEEDTWFADKLKRSEKDGHEHDVVLDAIRDQLGPYAADVRTGERDVRKLATVQHLQTDVQAELANDHHVLELVDALHPTPAVGGMPQNAALETIREHEAFDRGWYSAPIGWIDAEGNGRFAVAIRSAVARDRKARLFAGAGIVADSDPDREWGELQLKYRPVLDELE